MVNYQEALDWIHSREKFKVKPGLKRMDWMLDRLGNPHKDLNAVHIAGTNGKGSTLSFLRHLLQEQGYSIGAFTSPYITRFNERISVDGYEISDADLADLVGVIRPIAEELKKTHLGDPTEFEIITTIAMLHFSRLELDFVLFETGLGGRYDSTNVITPLLSIITNVGLDHINILGSTHAEIAGEKAGIIKKDTPVITGVKRRDALEVIAHEAEGLDAPLLCFGDDFNAEHIREEEGVEIFVFTNSACRSGELKTRMRGAHQVENAALAVQACEVLNDLGYYMERKRYASALYQTSWPARFETVGNNPLTIIDGAHNEEGTQALVETVRRHYSNRRVTLVYAALEDKPVEKMLGMLDQIADAIYFTTFDFPRSLKAEQLREYSSITNSYVYPDYREAIKQASSQVERGEVLLITGSLYFISLVRDYFELV
ncbi:bifunctional folylpolyglutamate synthase/dihydrofolate synthase [Halobacillus yeomjeoni]|uniref:bifunctional folylpolyglutamate synthase/dihydrofolate synthase n=1 Tax=Halobacillus yeomjeoni TaxID=311194 RepID=UPI001CD2519D|nr:folylpolyglutamate synthase/dihydrofolate synthase family protein [Halobacillus yeomjeoni]MCA0982587.1 bifunctional folylpolyglutamate synthase/dihydrofolate synthase [Halobacillus yeomjeoni]